MRSMLRCGRFRDRAGFTLVEVVLSMIMVAVLLVAVMRTVGATTRAAARRSDELRGQLLAQALMDEILQQAHEEPWDNVDFGPEPSEVGATRAAFDDIDDYHEWNVSSTPVPPQDKSGQPYPGVESWVRTVMVEAADPDDLNAPGNDADGIKRITVEVRRDGRLITSLVMIMTESWIPPPYE